MKKLTRVKLINWHRFVNNTIEFDDSTLLTGENGAGKSTLLDAIQFVAICSTASFNKAAHDNGKRKLTGYVRCKTGKENQAYERTGEISAHVALEFYEEKKNQYFVVGAVIDSASEGQEKSARYLMDKTMLDDIEFLKDNVPQSITRFRGTHGKRIKTWCTTDKDARVMIKNRFGRIEDKFFHLIPKAMAFRPIDNIKDFVYSYVLDKKEVNIDILRENVRTYQELQKTLDSVKIRIGKLERIETFHEQIVKGMESDRMYDYYLEHAEADIIYGEIRALERRLKNSVHQMEETEEKISQVMKEKRERQEIRDDLHTELASDKDFIARDEQMRKLEYLEIRRQELEPEHRALLHSADKSAKAIGKLSRMEEAPSCINRYLSMLKQIADTEQISDFREVLDDVLNYKKETYDRAHVDLARTENDHHHMAEQLTEVEGLISQLQRKRLSYPQDVTRVLEAIREEFDKIGRNAIKVQLQQAEEKRKQLNKRLRETADQMADIRRLMNLLSVEADTDIKYRIDVLTELRRVKQDMDKCRANIETLEKNTNMLQKQLQLAALEDILRNLDAEISSLNSRKGALQEKIRAIAEQIQNQQGNHAQLDASCKTKLAEAGNKGMLWEKEYQKQMTGKTPEQFRDNFARRKKANLTTTGDAEKAMIQVMAEYKTAHDFGASPDLEGYGAFAAEYRKLHDSELLQYEEKVSAARNAAEEEFREQFLSKLQENMKIAQGEFKDLNKALKDIAFSNEKYEFLHMPSRRHRQYYEMIMDDFNVVQGESIFSGTFHETHKEVIDELFQRLALDSENQVKTLEEFTDYRTYMDYDIKIIHSDDSYSYYSKVCEEKSGGETQTPFYVTVAASFVQLYRNSIGGEAIGLVMFDEAFNNMDDERIGGVLEFLGRLPLQIVIAAPPDKIQYISPYVAETQLIMTDEKVSFAERYHNGAI